jgi:hypothetical protein
MRPAPASLLGAALFAVLFSGACSAFAAGPGTGSYTYQCAPYQVIQGAPYPTSGPYTAGADGIVTGVAANDARALDNAGCRLVGAGGNAYELLGRLVGANFNSTTDQPFVWLAAPSTSYRVTKITCTNASTSLSTAAGGVYTAASKGGAAIVASTQAFTGLTGGTLALDLTIATSPGNTFFASTNSPILSLSTAQGAAATADCYVYGQLGQ